MGEGRFAWLLVAVIIASSLMALAYVWRIIETLYFRPAVVEQAPGEAPPQLLAIAWLVALANIGFGLFPQFPLALANAAAELLLRYSL